MAPYANFVRPIFNGVYWLLGLFLTPDDGARLLLNCLAIGVLTALTYLAMVAKSADKRIALILAAAVPLMSAVLPALAIMQPFLAFDPLVACICLGAYLTYLHQRHGLTAILLLLAVMMKETALPVALAVPLHYAWEQGYRNRPVLRPTVMFGTAILAMPLCTWLLLRWLSFGDVTGGTYALDGHLPTLIRKAVMNVIRWPFWGPLPAGQLLPDSAAGFQSLCINLALISCGLVLMFNRLRLQGSLDLAELCMVFSYGLMLLTGVYARLGVVLDVFVLISVMRWLQDRSLPFIFSRGALMAVSAGLLLNISPTIKILSAVPPLFMEYQSVGRDYVQQLRKIEPGRRVLVLNDPITWHSHVGSLVQVMQVKADVSKLADFACPGSLERIRSDCTVTLTVNDERHFEFAQSCGLSVCGARAANEPVRVKMAPDVQIELLPMQHTGKPEWGAYRATLDRGNLDLLYFDPSSRSFRVWRVP